VILLVAGTLGSGVILINFASKEKSASALQEEPALDSHGHPIAANVSSAALDNLIDKAAPSFQLVDRDGKIYSSESLRGKNVVLFFNEGLMCYPACWNQIVAFSNDERFGGDDTVVLSVVIDSAEEWQQAIKKMPELAKATVVFDNGASVSNKFGMLKTASSMHYGAFPGHTYVLMDKEGLVRHVFDDPNMALHNDQLSAELKKLN
ncbi:MAG: redoxin domain-containing protein, partial [Candidatus Nealsonbacteria bacterium]|nr:redoxin domain-containing protein [Candidatus Nealsonbacteria bacterium]